MSILSLLIPVSLVMGAVGLAAFFWSLRSGQFDDLEGDAERILFHDDDAPLERQERPAGREKERFT